MLEPKFAHTKSYWVQVEGSITDEALVKLRHGVTISVTGKRYTTKPARATELELEPDVPERNPPIRYRKNIPTSWIELTITEGKNRQVRKMCAAVGFPVLRLVRSGIGKVGLNGLMPGKWKEIDASVISNLKH